MQHIESFPYKEKDFSPPMRILIESASVAQQGYLSGSIYRDLLIQFNLPGMSGFPIWLDIGNAEVFSSHKSEKLDFAEALIWLHLLKSEAMEPTNQICTAYHKWRNEAAFDYDTDKIWIYINRLRNKLDKVAPGIGKQLIQSNRNNGKIGYISPIELNPEGKRLSDHLRLTILGILDYKQYLKLNPGSIVSKIISYGINIAEAETRFKSQSQNKIQLTFSSDQTLLLDIEKGAVICGEKKVFISTLEMSTLLLTYSEGGRNIPDEVLFHIYNHLFSKNKDAHVPARLVATPLRKKLKQISPDLANLIENTGFGFRYNIRQAGLI